MIKVNSFPSENNDQDNLKKEKKINRSDEEFEDKVWTSISNVSKKYQPPLDSLIVDEVHNPIYWSGPNAERRRQKFGWKNWSQKSVWDHAWGEYAHALSVASRPWLDITVFQTLVKDSRPRLADIAEHHNPRTNSFYWLFLYLPTLPKSNGWDFPAKCIPPTFPKMSGGSEIKLLSMLQLLKGTWTMAQWIAKHQLNNFYFFSIHEQLVLKKVRIYELCAKSMFFNLWLWILHTW